MGLIMELTKITKRLKNKLHKSEIPIIIIIELGIIAYLVVVIMGK